MSSTNRWSWVGVTFVAAVLAAVGMVGAGCGDDLVSEQPPGGGGFDAGSTGTGAGYGTGASYGTGGSGGEEPPGPPDCEEQYRRCPHEFTLDDYETAAVVELHGDFAPDGWTVGVPMTLVGTTWTVEVDVPWDAPVEYKFVVDDVWMADPGNPDQVPDGFGGFNSVVDGITCDWWSCETPVLGYDWRDAVLYFVFVDRFNNGNPGNDGTNPAGVETPAAYQGGDWAGVTAKIDEGYFDDLGVNTLWLSVPMDNTEAAGMGDDGHNHSAYHAYWPRDLDITESRFGTLDELVTLVETAHDHDIKVILDYAMNHVHESAPIYQEHSDWFWPLQNGAQYCVCGVGCSWDGAEGRRCWFREYLPDFNFTVQAARDYSVQNAIDWIQSTGIDGFRLDAVKHIEDQWLLDLRARVTSEIESVSQQHFYMVGETFTGDRDTIKYYVNPSTMLDGQFDFPLRASIIATMLTRSAPLGDLDTFIQGNLTFYGTGIMSTFIGNHDVPRVVHFAQDSPLWTDVWDNGKNLAWWGQPGLPTQASAFERLANAYTLLFTLPGVPLIYYGDEIALPGAGDPDNRRFMQWQGYTTNQTNLRTHIAKLAEIRAAHPALRRGSRSTLSVTADTLAYRMQEAGDDVIVVINRADVQNDVTGLPAGTYLDEITSTTVSGPQVSLPARTARILVAQ